jgi:hypothetical protein
LAAEDGAQPLIALKAALSFDGKSKALIANGVVLVQSGIIKPPADVPIPADAKVIEQGTPRYRLGLSMHASDDRLFTPYNERDFELETEIPFAAYEAIPHAERRSLALLRCAMLEARISWMSRCAMRSGSCAVHGCCAHPNGIGASGHFDYTNGSRHIKPRTKLHGWMADGPEEIRKTIRCKSRTAPM